MIDLGADRARQIEVSARELVLMYQCVFQRNAYELSDKPYSALGQTQDIHPNVREFGEFVVKQVHEQDWGKGAFPLPATAETLPLLRLLDVRDVAAPAYPSLGGYGSWLYAVSPGQYAVVFDDEEILTRCRSANRTVGEAKSRLYLHEIGHLVMHRACLFQRKKKRSRGLAGSASAVMELEAWLFAGLVTGLVIGDRACSAKRSGAPDTSWQFF